ncbi:hypothetical protein FB451DRAFT_1170446 [Mycena latifolia]|nr:hypothetical protein FB451DRAFT_1170446 [Mycena latifolia]
MAAVDCIGDALTRDHLRGNWVWKFEIQGCAKCDVEESRRWVLCGIQQPLRPEWLRDRFVIRVPSNGGDDAAGWQVEYSATPYPFEPEWLRDLTFIGRCRMTATPPGAGSNTQRRAVFLRSDLDVPAKKQIIRYASPSHTASQPAAAGACGSGGVWRVSQDAGQRCGGEFCGACRLPGEGKTGEGGTRNRGKERRAGKGRRKTGRDKRRVAACAVDRLRAGTRARAPALRIRARAPASSCYAASNLLRTRESAGRGGTLPRGRASRRLWCAICRVVSCVVRFREEVMKEGSEREGIQARDRSDEEYRRNEDEKRKERETQRERGGREGKEKKGIYGSQTHPRRRRARRMLSRCLGVHASVPLLFPFPSFSSSVGGGPIACHPHRPSGPGTERSAYSNASTPSLPMGLSGRVASEDLRGVRGPGKLSLDLGDLRAKFEKSTPKLGDLRLSWPDFWLNEQRGRGGVFIAVVVVAADILLGERTVLRNVERKEERESDRQSWHSDVGYFRSSYIRKILPRQFPGIAPKFDLIRVNILH